MTSVGIGRLRASDPYFDPTDSLAALFPQWEVIWVSVCKTLGIAYVGSNPTPATRKIIRR